MSKRPEAEETFAAIVLAKRILDRVADPDDDLAILARQFLRARREWQPIDTAPKEVGARILAFIPKDSERDDGWTRLLGGKCHVLQWTGSEFTTWALPGVCGLKPTHWMPLPKEPK